MKQIALSHESNTLESISRGSAVTWMGAAIAIVVAVVSAASALLSARSARIAQQQGQITAIEAQSRIADAQAESHKSLQKAEQQSIRARELESRLSVRKYESYEPIINALSAMLTPAAVAGAAPEVNAKQWSEFGTWIGIFGSDESLRAWRNLQQATYAGAPPLIFIRLYAEFLQAARRDIGDDRTAVTLTELVGVRFKDLYTSPDIIFMIEAPWTEIEANLEWRRPWV